MATRCVRGLLLYGCFGKDAKQVHVMSGQDVRSGGGGLGEWVCDA